MIQADKIIKNVRMTEKSNKLSANYGQYTFEVYPAAVRKASSEPGTLE